MVLRLRVRRLTCEDVSCGRGTFVEQVAGLTRPYTQRTERMRSVLAEVGLWPVAPVPDWLTSSG